MAVKKSGQLVLFRFPQTDLLPGKFRPALLLAPLPSPHRDWLVCMISTQIAQAVTGVDEVINAGDADFTQSGLKTASVIRLTRLAVVSDSVFTGFNRPDFRSTTRWFEKAAGSMDRIQLANFPLTLTSSDVNGNLRTFRS